MKDYAYKFKLALVAPIKETGNSEGDSGVQIIIYEMVKVNEEAARKRYDKTGD